MITAKILEDRTDSTDFVYDIICAEFPKSCVLKDAAVSCADAGGVQVTQSVDILYISRGGVMIISVVNGDGAFDNPKSGPWRYRYVTNDKTVTTALPNPFDTMISSANLLEGLLASEKIYLDVQKVTVFSGNKVGMTTQYPEVLTVANLTAYLKAFDQRDVINGPQFRTASEVITAFAQYNQHKAMSQRRFPTSDFSEDSFVTDQDPEAALAFDIAESEMLNTDMDVDESNASNDETMDLLREVENAIEETQNEEPEMILNMEEKEAE